MYLNSLFSVMLLFFAVGVRNGLVQGLSIGPQQIPDQCASACASASQLFNTCNSLPLTQIQSCVCTPASDTAIQQCLNCVFPIDPSIADPSGVVEMARQEFNAVCTLEGLPALTYPATTPTTPIAKPPTPIVTPPTVTTPTTPIVTPPTVTTPILTPPTVTTPILTPPTDTPPTDTSPTVTPPTVSNPAPASTLASTTPSEPSTVGSTPSASASPTSGAELSVQSQLSSMGIAIAVSLLLRLL